MFKLVRNLSKINWPGGASFALFLTHDVDQIYDREFFRLLGDLNHLRRIWINGESGSTVRCTQRILRSIFRPRKPGHDIEAILSIEQKFGFHSTFFLLEDKTFNRLGGRYRYTDPEIQMIAKSILLAGCEIALHGAFHNFNVIERYKSQVKSFYEAFGVLPKGIRNHDLRHDGIDTWISQCMAGFLYDSSFGDNNEIGNRDGKMFPFFPLHNNDCNHQKFLVIPMTIMDSALFWGMRLSANEAFERCQQVALQVINKGGLLCLNWHNNYFNDHEYPYWEEIYEQLLTWLATKKPWNATGVEITGWWINHYANNDLRIMGNV